MMKGDEEEKFTYRGARRESLVNYALANEEAMMMEIERLEVKKRRESDL